MADVMSLATALTLALAPAPTTTPDPDMEKAARRRIDKPFMKRWAPERGMIELGGFLGAYLPGNNHELFQASTVLPDQGFRPLQPAGLVIGGRSGYTFLKPLVIEGELTVAPIIYTTDNAQRVTLYSVRAGAVGQLPFWSIVPFAVVGGGVLGVASSRDALGNDADPMMYFGGGVKANIARMWQLRLDVRDVVSNKRGVSATFQNHNAEAYLSLVVTLGRAAPEKIEPPPRVDSDGDGFWDDEDRCPDEPGIAPRGCPVKDSDGDGVYDAADSCPDDKGIEPHGCPPEDSDGDGVPDDADACVEEAADTPDGCPDVDSDGDGIGDRQDRCVDEPETVNRYLDEDGCPDEIPSEVSDQSGVLDGVVFDAKSAEILDESFFVLDELVDVLIKYPAVKLEISGHTDNRGDDDDNVALSKARADAVADYLSGKGIQRKRITTRGAGPHEPVESNKTKSGRAANDRIELRLEF